MIREFSGIDTASPLDTDGHYEQFHSPGQLQPDHQGTSGSLTQATVATLVVTATNSACDVNKVGSVNVMATAIPGTSFSDCAVAPGQTYYYVVRALDGSGNQSAGSGESVVNVPAS